MINAHCGFGTSGNPQVYDMNLCLSLLCYIFFSRHNKIIEAVTPNTGVESKTLENQTPKTSKQANNLTEPEPMPTCSWKAKLKNDFNAMPIQIMTSSTFSLQWLCLCCQCPCGRCCSSAGGGGGIVVFVVLVLPVMVLVVLVLVLVVVVVLVVAAPIFAVTELTPPSSPDTRNGSSWRASSECYLARWCTCETWQAFRWLDMSWSLLQASLWRGTGDSTYIICLINNIYTYIC